MPNDSIQGGYFALKELILAAVDDVVRAPAGERDDYSPSYMRVFDSTDDDQVFVGDGDDWTAVTSMVVASSPQDPTPPEGPTQTGGEPKDLLTNDGTEDGALAVHDGTGAPARGLCEWRDDDDDWYSYADDALLSTIA